MVPEIKFPGIQNKPKNGFKEQVEQGFSKIFAKFLTKKCRKALLNLPAVTSIGVSTFKIGRSFFKSAHYTAGQKI